MNLDNILIKAIEDACIEENAREAIQPIVRFIERYVSNELPESQVASNLQGIYELLKD